MTIAYIVSLLHFAYNFKGRRPSLEAQDKKKEIFSQRPSLLGQVWKHVTIKIYGWEVLSDTVRIAESWTCLSQHFSHAHAFSLNNCWCTGYKCTLQSPTKPKQSCDRYPKATVCLCICLGYQRSAIQPPRNDHHHTFPWRATWDGKSCVWKNRTPLSKLPMVDFLR